MKNTLSLVAIMCSCIVFSADSQDDVSTVYVGGTPMLLPTPKGYYRIDGKNEKVDTAFRASVGKDVRPLAWYGSEVALAEALSGRMPLSVKLSTVQRVNFQALTGTLIEKISVSQTKFQSIKQNVVKDSKAFVDGFDPREMGAAGSEAMSIMLRKAVSLRVGEMISLGVFDESPESVSYCYLMKAEFPGADARRPVSTVLVGALSSVLLRDHLIQLGCGTTYQNPSDISLVRDLLKRWKDAVVIANR